MEITIDLLVAIGTIATAVATIALVIMLFKTIKHMESASTLSRVQTHYRFRAWVGPSNGIKKMDHSPNEKCAFDVTIKNYGEIPASRVDVKFKMDTKPLTRDALTHSDVMTFNLGPLLPNMEKHYWFFVETELWKKAEAGEKEVFTAIYFEYPVMTGVSGYGMLSKFNPESKNFVHSDMWIGEDELKQIDLENL